LYIYIPPYYRITLLVLKKMIKNMYAKKYKNGKRFKLIESLEKIIDLFLL
jgi:hypothetical protein